MKAIVVDNTHINIWYFSGLHKTDIYNYELQHNHFKVKIKQKKMP